MILSEESQNHQRKDKSAEDEKREPRNIHYCSTENNYMNVWCTIPVANK